MSKTVQIRDLDNETYQVLRKRAAADGLSLAGYLRRELTQMAAVPTMAEWLDRADESRARAGVSREALQSAIEDLHLEREAR